MSHEQLQSAGEKTNAEVGQEAAKRSAELREKSEHIPTPNQKEREQVAHKEALEAAKEIKEHQTEKEPSISESESPITSKRREQSFKQTMTHIQAEMPKGERAFSKVIHNPTIEKVSDIVGATVARPTSIAAGSLCAFIAVFTLYLIAKNAGFSLSGFETIGAFIAGWLFGILIDLVRSMFRK